MYKTRQIYATFQSGSCQGGPEIHRETPGYRQRSFRVAPQCGGLSARGGTRTAMSRDRVLLALSAALDRLAGWLAGRSWPSPKSSRLVSPSAPCYVLATFTVITLDCLECCWCLPGGGVARRFTRADTHTHARTPLKPFYVIPQAPSTPPKITLKINKCEDQTVRW